MHSEIARDVRKHTQRNVLTNGSLKSDSGCGNGLSTNGGETVLHLKSDTNKSSIYV